MINQLAIAMRFEKGVLRLSSYRFLPGARGGPAPGSALFVLGLLIFVFVFGSGFCLFSLLSICDAAPCAVILFPGLLDCQESASVWRRSFSRIRCSRV